MTPSVDRIELGARLKREREQRAWSQAEMARQIAEALTGKQVPALDTLRNYINRWESGGSGIGPRYRRAYADALDTTVDELFSAAPKAVDELSGPVVEMPQRLDMLADLDGELEALDLARRVAASDVGGDTLVSLESVVDELASAYPLIRPDEVLARARRHLTYVSHLMDARMTLAERRRLVAVGGWLSLLAATCDVDLGQRSAAAARLRTAAQLAEHAEHHEILAWTLETRAWQKITDGNYGEAIKLARGAQAVAPRNGSAFIQATAQEGRAWSRLHASAETRDALARVERLVSPLPVPDRPEHHYRYDPGKNDAYIATTLSWLGDPAAEPYARGVLARLDRPTDGPARPRRAVSARLDLALALLAADQPDEAAQTALEAVSSGRLVPSNYWRAAEVITAVDALSLPEATDLNEAYRALCAPAEHPNKPS